MYNVKDQLNVSLTLDWMLTDLWLNLESHHNVYLLDEPLTISENVTLPKPIVAQIGTCLGYYHGWK